MPEIDLTNKRAVILGLPGSGKSELLKHILRQSKNHLVYDTLNEHYGFNRYVPHDRESSEELDRATRALVTSPVKGRRRPSLYVIDEANKFIQPKPSRLPPAIADLNDYSRHWDVAWLAVARRPSQFHTDIMELCHYLFLFQLPGKNDIDYLESRRKGLGLMVAGLAPFHFVVSPQQGEPFIHAPIDISPKK